MAISKVITPLDAVKAIKQLDAEKLPNNLGSSAANKIVITDETGAVKAGEINVTDVTSATTKLNTIEENAQVNKIEVVKVNDTALEITDKTVNIDIPEYTIIESTASSEYSKSYSLTKDGVETGVKINIPKDLVISSGSVETCEIEDTPYAGAKVGDKYLDILLNDPTKNHIYIPVKDLVDVYTAGDGITVSNTNEISVNVDEANSNGLNVSNSGLGMSLATAENAGAMSAADFTKLADLMSYDQLIKYFRYNTLQQTSFTINIDDSTSADLSFTYTGKDILKEINVEKTKVMGADAELIDKAVIQSVEVCNVKDGQTVLCNVQRDFSNIPRSELIEGSNTELTITFDKIYSVPATFVVFVVYSISKKRVVLPY